MVSFACKRLAYLHVSHYDAGHNLFLGKKSPFMASILLSNWMISTSSGGTGSEFFGSGMGQEISCLDFLTYSWQEMAFLSCLVSKFENLKILSCLDFVTLFLTLSCLENFENWKFLSCLDLVNLVLTHWRNYHFIEISAFFGIR